MNKLVLMTALVAAIPIAAEAQPAPPPCASLPGTVVYAQVGDTQLNLMKRLGRALRDNTPNPITLVFRTSGSCTNITQIYTRVPMKGVMSYIPSVAEDAAWVPTASPLTCTIPDGQADPGVVPDIANSALFNSACPNGAAPETVQLTQGPVQAYVLAVPTASSQTAITFEEAYFVFGWGAAGMVQPWIDEAQLFIRTITKSTLLAWAANIGVPAEKWKGIRHDGSPMVVDSVKAGPASAIGILGAEVYDGNRLTMKALAFRAKGQYAAYYPDSSASARDKKNVRDGHYTVWSPTIWMDTVTVAGTTKTPVNPTARYVINLIAGLSVAPAQNFSMIDVIAAVGLVPECAMGVNRDFEGGPLRLYTPPESCVCKYESLVSTSSCAACTAGSCATGVCRNGFCEAR